MAVILPFSEISLHLKSSSSNKILMDTCALISLAHDTNIFHDETLELVKKLKRKETILYTNVNIRSEFIDFHRRLFITEALTDLSQQVQGILSYNNLVKKLKSHRSNVHKRAEKGNPLVLNDSDIKHFKNLLSFEHKNIDNVWLHFCENNLKDKLELSFKLIEKTLKLSYLSLRKGEHSPEINRDVSWENMYAISEKSGLGISDSMILNMFESTSLPILITTDFDLVYASAISESTKVVFCPQNIYQSYLEKLSSSHKKH